MAITGEIKNSTVSYADFDVALNYVDGNYNYYAYVSADKACEGGTVTLDGVFEKEFSAFDTKKCSGVMGMYYIY